MMNTNNLQSVNVPILNLDDLKIISPLGRGAKGIVFLVKEPQYGQMCALKLILRDLIEKKKNNNNKDDSDHANEYKRVRFEQRVLSRFNHPLLPHLRGVLATEKIVGYAIDFCPGRDLHQLRKQQSERMFSVDIIRFFAAELVLVLEHLHNLGIVYRDLKPENILIQENGHIMLVDFDLSTEISSTSGQNPSPTNSTVAKSYHFRRKRRFFNCFCNSKKADSHLTKHNTSLVAPESDPSEKSNSFVGTEEYIPPEMIQCHGHDFAVDLWSLGVVLYEMLYGKTPFKGSNRKETFFRILSTAPDLVGEATPLRDLIRRLLVKDPTGRIKLGEIKGHEFFRGVDWEMMVEMSRPPYIPPAGDEFLVKDGKEEIMNADLESFVERIFRGGEGEVENKKHDQNNNFIVF